MFNKSDLKRNGFMLDGPFAKKGYDWWWHSFTAIDAENGEEKSFFIEFYTCNPALGGKDPVFGQLPENQEKGIRPSYLMVKAGCWGEDACQLHRFFGWQDVRVHSRAPYYISADDCYASDNLLKGHISLSEEEVKAHPEYMSDAGEMSWELTVDKQIAFNVGYGASSFFRLIKAFEMYWHAEGMKTVYSGEIRFNGRKYIVLPELCYGYADKNWGRDFTSPWVWLSANALFSARENRMLANSVFDIGGGCPKVYFVPLKRKLLGALYYEGREFEFNFSKFWTRPKTQFESHQDDEKVYWHVVQENRTHVMETDIECLKKDMLKINYEAPNGRKRHNNLYNGGTGTGTVRLYVKTAEGRELIDGFSVTHCGCEYGEYDS